MKKTVFKVFSLLLIVVLVLTAVPVAALAVDVPDVPQKGIPLVIVRVDESEATIAAAMQSNTEHQYGTIADMNASENHAVRCKGTVEIKVPQGYVSEYGSASVPLGEVELDYIRGRGNSTWSTQENAKNHPKITHFSLNKVKQN